MYPVKIIPEGDKVAAERYRKFGKQQMDILRNQMSFQKLTKGSRQVSPLRGVLISCESRYNTHVVSIYVDPAIHLKEQAEEIALALRKRKHIRKTETLAKKIAYFVRIKYPDPEVFPQDLDGWGEVIYDELSMDRIIVWDMRFDFGESDLTDLENKINRYNGFVPGAGSIKYDVDIVNEVVYLPSDLTGDEETALIARVKEQANILPTNAEPDKGLPNKTKDWFYTGHLANPREASVSASPTGSPTLPSYDIAVKLNESFAGFYPIMSPPPNRDEFEYKLIADYTTDLATWRADWAPSYGGDPDQLMTNYHWVGIDDVIDYYGEYDIPYLTGGGDLIVMSNTEITLSGDPYVIATIAANFPENTVENEIGIKGGFYFTSTSLEGVNTFFVVQKTPWFSYDEVWVEMRFTCSVGSINCPYGSPLAYPIGSVMPAANPEEPGDVAVIHVWDASPGISGLITPLETISKTDYISTYSEETGECWEFSGTIWDSFDSISALVHSPSAAWGSIFETFRSYYGTENITGDYDVRPSDEIVPWFRKNITDGFDTHSLCNVFAVNNKQVILDHGLKINSKYFSLFYFDEKKAKYKSSVYYGDAYCNGVNYYNWEDAPAGKFGSVGCVIYIFAPKTFVNYDDQGNVASYWDIHSAQRDEGIINPYRCIDLEEYIMSIVQGIQQDLDDNSSVSKLDSATDNLLAATLNYYGYGITNGFFYSGNAVTEATETYADNQN